LPITRPGPEPDERQPISRGEKPEGPVMDTRGVRPVSHKDVVAERQHLVPEALAFETRLRRDVDVESADVGPPANREEQSPQPFTQRVRRGDLGRLGF